METKRCGKCGQHLLLEQFHKCSREKSGLQQWCKTCRKNHKPEDARRRSQDRYYNHNDNYRDSVYKRKYKISLKDYNEMLDKQGGGCKICGGVSVDGRRLSVDHDHSTGAARGLLCTSCNRGLGAFSDDIDKMEKAITYLKEYRND